MIFIISYYWHVILYLQYKFVVDGEWRHDDRQPSISSNLGTVNTILLTRESDYRPAMPTPQMPSAGPGASMDVDNAVGKIVSHVYFKNSFSSINR